LGLLDRDFVPEEIDGRYSPHILDGISDSNRAYKTTI
jgi:hypothetical protein